MKRKQWQKKSNELISCSRMLFSNKNFSQSYYLAGLSVECALKSVICKQFQAHTWPEKRFVNDIYQHGLRELVKHAGLESDRVSKAKSSPDFSMNWSTVVDWKVDSRYLDWSEKEAQDMLNASKKRGSGVLPWIKKHW